MPSTSTTHLVVIPSYNTGARVVDTARAAAEIWDPVWVVIDGSTDRSEEMLNELARELENLRILSIPQNSGKGSAVLLGAQKAAGLGFTHVLAMDADGQHPANQIKRFIELSIANPGALILGKPQFEDNAPRIRVHGRKLCNFWVNLETLWSGIHDSLFGLRIYPIADLRAVMEGKRFSRRFDFDPEVAVRMCWRGLPTINIPCPVRYFSAEEGGISQFRYLRDNKLLVLMHCRLLAGFLLRLPLLALRRIGILRKRDKGQSPDNS